MTMISEDRLRELADKKRHFATAVMDMWNGEPVDSGEVVSMATELLSLRTSPPPSGEAGEPKLTGYLFRLRYGPDNWSHQMMYAEALPKEGDYREVTPLYALPTIKEPTDGK